MAPPEPYSPSPTSKLLPFLQGRPRRGSIASVSSRTEVDKETLSQVLDVIHTSASKADGLTSFHDYDRSNVRSGPKEKVTSGVTGLYNKLKQSVGSGTAAPREQKDTQNSQSTEAALLKNASRGSLAVTESHMGASLSATRPTDGAAVKNPRESASTLLPSPLLQDTSLNARRHHIPTSPSTATLQAQKIDSRATPAALIDDVVRSTGERVDTNTDSQPQIKGKSQDDANRSGMSRTDVPRNEAASAALARVLHTHETTNVANPSRKALQVSTTFEVPVNDSDTSDGSADLVHSTQSNAHTRGVSATTHLTADLRSAHSRGEPSQTIAAKAVKNGDSTIPSPAGDADADSITSSRTNTTRSAAGTSSNINGALQRRRTGLKHAASNSMDSHAGLSSHLKRRVLSKEFCMSLKEIVRDCS
jgi:1-phosphatidylinositol-3-phosphate 5-kinase